MSTFALCSFMAALYQTNIYFHITPGCRIVFFRSILGDLGKIYKNKFY